MKHILLTTLALLGGLLDPSIHAQTAIPAVPGQLINGDFSQGSSNGLPNGWSFTKTPYILEPRKKQAGKIPNGVTIATLQEGSKAIVRITYNNKEDGCLVQLVDLPPKTKRAYFKVSVRGAPDQKGGKQSMPDAGFRFFSAGGDYLPERKASPPPNQLSDKSWREIDFNCDVPPNATSCHVIFGNTGNTNATFDFRNVRVRFH